VSTATVATYDERLAEQLVLDELFDLSLYKALRERTGGEARKTLDELIPIEARHYSFWQEFFDLRRGRLDVGRRIKLRVLLLVEHLKAIDNGANRADHIMTDAGAKKRGEVEGVEGKHRHDSSIQGQSPFEQARLEHVQKKLLDFFDSDMLQLFDFELRPYRSNI
jgi:hypothetical protein